jgi:hypothetical protein
LGCLFVRWFLVKAIASFSHVGRGQPFGRLQKRAPALEVAAPKSLPAPHRVTVGTPAQSRPVSRSHPSVYAEMQTRHCPARATVGIPAHRDCVAEPPLREAPSGTGIFNGRRLPSEKWLVGSGHAPPVGTTARPADLPWEGPCQCGATPPCDAEPAVTPRYPESLPSPELPSGPSPTPRGDSSPARHGRGTTPRSKQTRRVAGNAEA